MDAQPKKNKKIISDMVVPVQKKSSSVSTPTQRAVSKAHPIESRPQTRPIKPQPVPKIYQEEIIEETYSNMEDSDEIESIDKSRFKNIDMDAVMQERRNYGGCLLWFIAAVCGIAIILGIGGLVAHAKITIARKQWTGPINQSITLAQNPYVGQIAFATETQSFTDSVVIPSTGTSVSSAKSTGTVRFYNSTNYSKTIPLGTVIVSSKNISYATAKKIIIPAQKKTTPGQADVVVAAVTAGSESNSSPDDFTFASLKTTGVTIHSITAIIGGVSANMQTANPDQLSQAQTQIAQYFADVTPFVSRMSNEIPKTMIVLPIQIAPAIPTITTDGSQSDGVHVLGTESITVLLVNKSDIAKSLGSSLNIPETIKTLLPSFDQLTVTTATALSAGSIPQTLAIHVSGTATVVGSVDAKTIQMQLMGISRAKARTLLAAIPEIDHYSIKLSPPWRHVLPAKLGQITVTVN